jgi:hypothetical protein
MMFERFLQATILTFLLSLILQLGSSTGSNSELKSNYLSHSFPSQVTKPFSKAINQVLLSLTYHLEHVESIRRWRGKLSYGGFPKLVSHVSHRLEN